MDLRSSVIASGSRHRARPTSTASSGTGVSAAAGVGFAMPGYRPGRRVLESVHVDEQARPCEVTRAVTLAGERVVVLAKAAARDQSGERTLQARGRLDPAPRLPRAMPGT